MRDNQKLYIGAYILNKHARTEKHIKQIKKAKIDFMVSIDYNDKPLLDLFEKYSIGAIVNGVFPSWWGSDGEKSGQMALANPIENYEKCIKSYTHHNAVWGIDIGDEISCMDFEYVNTILKTYGDFFKDKMMYMNLYPNYGVRISVTEDERKKQWGCASYKEYIEKYCKEISLPYICFDHYPYCHNDLSMFIENLECVKEMADKYDKSIYLVAQSSSYDKDVFLNCTQLRTQAYIALAFDVKVIMWACYSAGWWHNHIVDENGHKTKLYRDIAWINREIKKFYKTYSQYKCCNVHILNLPARNLSVADFCRDSLIEDIEIKPNDSYIVCEMENLQTSKKDAMYVVNISENAIESKISFVCKHKLKVYCMDKNCKLKYNKLSHTYTLNLAPGYGAVIKIK